MDGSLTLWNVDDHSANAYQLADHADPMSNSTEAAKLSQFCLDCHDNDGAAAEASPFAPFTGSGAPPEVDSTHWSGSSHNTGGVTCFGDGSGGCHGSGHGSEKLVMLAPYDVPAIDPDRSEEREDFCFECHDSDGMSTIDVVAQYSSATNHQVTAPGPGAKINQRHDIYPADQAYSGGLVTCKNCHQQHMNTDAAPVGDPDTGLALATYDKTSTYTDDGSNLDYQDSSSDWDPTNPQGATGGPYSEPDYIQFCLACHDGTTPPGVTMSSGMGNMAILYGADNHGTVAGNTGSKTGKGKLKLPWNTQANFDAGDDPPYSYAALNCTTCHGSHGGDNIFNLKSEITVDGQALSVGGTGASYPGISGTTYVLPTSGGNQRDHYFGAWCTFCHTMDSHPGKDEEDACTGAHEHGGGSF
jgi:cytochrome c553